MKNSVKKEIIALVIFAVVFSAFLVFATRVTTPKRHEYGCTWGQYGQESPDSLDVLFFGSSIVYCDVIPSVIWDEAGLSSYIMAGPEQTISFSYYYLLQSLKTQSPELVCLELTGMFFRQYQDYSRINAGFMPFGRARLGATLNASEKKERTGLMFPLYNYHSRWSSLSAEDVAIALKGYEADDLAGYTYLDQSGGVTQLSSRGEENDEENYARNLGYLQKIALLCKDKGIKLFLFIAPTCMRLSDEHLSRLEADLASIDCTQYLDFNTLGLDAYDLPVDFYDELHFNVFGAQKFSALLAQELTGRFDLSPTENADAELWSYRSFRLRERMGTAE